MAYPREPLRSSTRWRVLQGAFTGGLVAVLFAGLTVRAEQWLTAAQRDILREPTTALRPAFGFDRPTGPAFTSEERQAQLHAGRGVLPLVQAAYARGAGQVRIPPGNYRFAAAPRTPEGAGFPLEFVGLRREADAPFSIDATGVTFWFDLGDEQMPPGHGCIRFVDCSNVIFRGATIDRGTRGVIEGRIVRLDPAGNRIELAVTPGCHVPASFKNGIEQRLLPFKSDGRFCAPLYDLQSGGLRLKYRHLEPSGPDGRYWLYLEHPALLETIANPEWREAYGELGILEPGDGLSCVYSTCQALVIARSRNITIHRVNVHVAKGGGVENGGWGGHLWKDCFFGPRPDTNQWQGGDGFMFNATRHGTTLDNVTIRHSTDDMANFHGYWGTVAAVEGRRVTFAAERHFSQLVFSNVAPGDRVRFYDKPSGSVLAEARIVAIDGPSVTLDIDADPFANALAEWPDQSCAGWTIQNCDWSDNYQRLLINSGPGVVRNNTFSRTGHGVSLASVMPYVEGGVPCDILIEHNRFTDVNPRPAGPAISSHTVAFDRLRAPLLRNILIRHNEFIRTGGAAIALRRADGVIITDNRFEAPLVYTARARAHQPRPAQPVQLTDCRDVHIERNLLLDAAALTRPHPVTGSPLVGVEGNSMRVRVDGRLLTDPR